MTKLAKYLADYIAYEETGKADDGLQEILEQGIDAFESTEQVKIRVVDISQPDIEILINLANHYREIENIE